MLIRKYEASDYPAINMLYYTCRPDEFNNEPMSIAPIFLSESPKALEKFTKSTVYVCEVGTDIVAFVTVSKGVIGWLYVEPNYRCLGIGGKLLQFLKSKMNENLVIYTLKSNRDAVNLYIKQGAAVVDEFIDPTLDKEIWVIKLRLDKLPRCTQEDK